MRTEFIISHQVVTPFLPTSIRGGQTVLNELISEKYLQLAKLSANLFDLQMFCADFLAKSFMKS